MISCAIMKQKSDKLPTHSAELTNRIITFKQLNCFPSFLLDVGQMSDFYFILGS